MSRSLADLEQYLVGHWRMENNFKDSSGNSNHGTPSSIEWKPTSRGMKPYTSDSGYISVGNIDFVEGDFSISYWIHPIGNGDAYPFYYRNGTHGGVWVYKGTCLIGDGTDRYSEDFPFEYGEWNHVLIVRNGNTLLVYYNGVLDGTETLPENFDVLAASEFLIGGSGIGSNSIDGFMDDLRIYITALDATEALALENTTATPPSVIPAERSYTHRLSPPVDNSTVFATDMHTKSGYELVDLSGNGNNGTVTGAVRSGGYFADGMRFNGVVDYIDAGDIDYSTYNSLYVSVLFNNINTQDAIIIGNEVNNTDVGFAIRRFTDGNIYCYHADSNVTSSAPKMSLIDFVISRGEYMSFYANGNLKSTDDTIDDFTIDSAFNTFIGKHVGDIRFFDDNILTASISTSLPNSDEIKSRFNSLAILPIFSFDAADYPANDTVYTSNIPYSSMIVTSGSFEINLDNELECITDGIVTMSCSHQFDESEYITLDIGGVKTSGTGSVTVGTIIASISQESNVITIDMDAGDKLSRLDTQFRAPVE